MKFRMKISCYKWTCEIFEIFKVFEVFKVFKERKCYDFQLLSDTLKTKAKDLDIYGRKSAEELGYYARRVTDWQCCGAVYPMARMKLQQGCRLHVSL